MDAAAGIHPGHVAPDFELPSTTGERMRLSGFRGRPVILRFGSFTWPITAGGVPPLKHLYKQYRDQAQFVDVFIRQAHPGERRGAYEHDEQKLEEARHYQWDEVLPWLALVDDVAGTIHQTYGTMSAPVYLIDADARVVFYGMWTHMPTLKQALDTLLAHGGRGTSGAQHIDHMLHVFVSFVNGWHALQRGGWRAVIDYEIGTLGAAALTFLGHVAKPVLAPLALRATPLPRTARIVLSSRVAVAAAFVIRAFRHHD